MNSNDSRGDVSRLPLFYWGIICLCAGFAGFMTGNVLSIFRLLLRLPEQYRTWNQLVVWYSGMPTSLGVVLIAADLVFLFPKKRRHGAVRNESTLAPKVTVVLTAYNDEESIGPAVRDFASSPFVERVVVVSNNSKDQTLARAAEAGAITVDELQPGYGRCVHRCLTEGLRFEDADYILLCEGDLTFRAGDIPKFLAYLPHADIVNGTRIVEQLREYSTQLSTLMYYGNFFVGKLLEVKHLGRGTFTDVGTTYKLIRRESLERLLPKLNPRINLEFNAHFLDVALGSGEQVVECPVTFHARVGQSKGGNVNNLRALKVGLRMIWGLSFGWR